MADIKNLKEASLRLNGLAGFVEAKDARLVTTLERCMIQV